MSQILTTPEDIQRMADEGESCQYAAESFCHALHIILGMDPTASIRDVCLSHLVSLRKVKLLDGGEP